MKNFLFLFFTFISVALNGQQNFINVPSSEATPKHKLFFQQQLNFNEIIQSNTTLDLGLGKNFEVGVNILGLNFSEKNRSFTENDTADKDPYNPLVLLNALKTISVSEKASITIGSQYGVNFRDNKKRREAGLPYVNFKLADLFIKNSSFILGAYYNSIHYGGYGNRFGIWAGTEIPVTHKFHLMAESIFGTNALSYTSVGIIYYPLKKMPLTLGIQIPNTRNNTYSLVFELTFTPPE